MYSALTYQIAYKAVSRIWKKEFPCWLCKKFMKIFNDHTFIFSSVVHSLWFKVENECANKV